MLSILLNIFLFLLGLGIGIKYERGIHGRTRGGHSKFQETGFAESRHSSSFKDSTRAKPGSKKGSSRIHIS